jgi:malyl-CoA/(S)-citramalyl-CoA lyase
MATLKTPHKFFQPLAAGAPKPFFEKPVRLERMLHFLAPHVRRCARVYLS